MASAKEPSTLDRYTGALLGLAAGDALGTTLEFKHKGSFTPIDDMVGGGPFRPKPSAFPARVRRRRTAPRRRRCGVRAHYGVAGVPVEWRKLITRREEIVRLATILLEDARP
jgi:hypothetical protein